MRDAMLPRRRAQVVLVDVEVVELDAVELDDRDPLQHPPVQRLIGLDVALANG